MPKVIAFFSLAAVAVLAFVFLNDPNEGPGFYPQCYFKSVTGYHCPGCGGTRAVHALLHADPGRAFFCNPLAMIAFPLLGGTLLWQWGQRRRKVPPEPWSKRRQFLVTVLAVGSILVFWVVRNLPGYPFL